MKRFLTIPLLFSFALLFEACTEIPDFPDEPQIEFVNVVYKELGTGTDALTDTILLTLRIKDGDGDLGLRSDEIFAPYHQTSYFDRTSNTFISQVVNPNNLLRYADRANPDYDTLPPFNLETVCKFWVEDPTINGEVVNDTIYVQANPFHYNIEVEFLVKQADQSFEVFEFNPPSLGSPCTPPPFSARFPIINDENNDFNVIDGTLVYKMQSFGHRVLFNGRTLKLRVKIRDRALNTSNTIETPEFDLDEIQQ